ncbi:MAG TPA: dTDP-4-dehydrorhamnose 3,5-epimerase [Caldilineaceae bacterium]|nr:dTDP-4-dehydrorhamnose 3,5-epimerase [Caldilineaceae bacterium]
MLFQPTKLADAYVIDLQKHEDERGFFARSWCRNEFVEQGLDPNLVQCNISFNKKAGTMRGMHFQMEPHAETKLVRCTSGAIYDVIVDVRPESSTFLQWIGVTLSAENRTMLYVPKGFAHGFQTLVDNTEVFYQMSEFYAPGYAAGFRWDDPLFAIPWPQPVTVISTKDEAYPNCTVESFGMAETPKGSGQ